MQSLKSKFLSRWLNFALVMAILFPATVFGRRVEKKTEKGQPVGPAQIRSVQEFRNLLKADGKAKRKFDKGLDRISLAMKALGESHFPKAILLGTPIQKDPLFADYGYWIVASAYSNKAEAQLKQKKYKLALGSAQQASRLALEIESRFPFSPFFRNVPRILTQVDRVMANSACAARNGAQCLSGFERTFLRLQVQKDLSSLEKPEIIFYAKACEKHPTTLCTNWLEKLLSVCSRSLKDDDSAGQIFQKLIGKGYGQKPILPQTPVFARATVPYKAPDLDQTAFDEALKLYWAGKTGASVKAFKQMLEDYPRSIHRLRARYWLGQALKKDGEKEESKRIFSELQADSALSFYGLMASRETAQSMDSLFPEHQPEAIDDDAALQPVERFHLDRAKKLFQLGAGPLAIYELKEVRPRAAFSSHFLVYLSLVNQLVKNYTFCFEALGQLIQRKFDGIISSFSLQMIFPVEFYEVIKQISAEGNLDSLLVLSLIKQESAFNEEANSSAGALGLMQLMPFTAVDTDPNVQNSHLLEAEKNIRVGSKYLKKLLTKYNGNIAYSLAAYNAGPTAAGRWIKEVNSRRKDSKKSRELQDPPPFLEFIEAITYRETRDYVAGIIRNYFWYSKKLLGTFPKNLEYFWGSDDSAISDLAEGAPGPAPAQN